MDMTRREVLKMVGAACIARPQQTEGPYYLDSKLNRSDIRTDPVDGSVAEGVPLLLEIHTCFEGAIVDVWHCDARGIYSGVRDRHFNTSGKRFLRGYQVTGKDGIARFQTIYPGWYPGRTVHIHFKIRPKKGREFTSQLYFDDALTDKICEQKPYSLSGKRTVRNRDDFIFRSGGDRLLLTLEPLPAGGYRSVFGISV